MSDDALRDLARRAGIAVEWQDVTGQVRTVTPEVLRRILAALGLPADARGDLGTSRRILTRHTRLTDLPPLITAIAGRPTRLELATSDPMPARLTLENGGSRDLTLTLARGRLRVPAIAELGYHRLEVEDREIVLAVAPAQCRTIHDIVPDARLWGLAAQVYSLRSAGDGGIGDASGITMLAEAAAARGADALCLSPLHALFSADPARFAPYSPSSRLFLNPLHASPALVFDAERVAQAARDAGVDAAFAQLESQALIDWPAAATAKLGLLRALFDSFLDEPGGDATLAMDFAAFRAEGGVALHEHACFEALHADRAPAHDWRQWPIDLRDPRGAAVAAFVAARQRDVLFHMFLQWLADRSLAVAQLRARAAGMRLGLIADLAVGMDASGSHAWSRQRDLLMGLSVGAPPDVFNPLGQCWNLTSFSPRALEAGGFAPFIATLRRALRHSGGVRIDHVMGLARLWLVPDGADPGDGAYLAYPMTDLMHLLALESVRHDAVVIGEDLGTVPDGFHETLKQHGVHGMRVMWFEREGQGFMRPEAWDADALAMTTTHDLPTVAGWWHGTDITERAAHGGLGQGVSVEQANDERWRDRHALWHSFGNAGVAHDGEPPPDVPAPVVDAALRFVARTNSPLAVLPLEDVLAQEEQPNLPGTIEQHPNWRRRLPGSADRLLQTDGTAARLAAVNAERPRQ